ncbi:MAG: hypothetical protein FJX52_15650, partial [Alphaproteobacteria bacterium]|nr:hypothetical protein [Alphaproteobacteria bacterium]
MRWFWRGKFGLVGYPHAEQATLELDVAREFSGRQGTCDPAIDHNRHGIGYRNGNAEILFDQQDGNLAFCGEGAQHV